MCTDNSNNNVYWLIKCRLPATGIIIPVIVVHSGETKIHDVSERSLAHILKLSLMYLKRLVLANATWVIWKIET